MATDGISRLINVTQMKSANANDDAMAGADKQRELINKQKEVRGMQRRIDALAKDGLTGAERAEIGRMLTQLDLSHDVLAGFRPGTDANATAIAKSDGDDNMKQNQKALDDTKAAFSDVLKALEGDDKLGSFEINDLMSNYNQAETLASSVRKKLDDTLAAQISKI